MLQDYAFVILVGVILVVVVPIGIWLLRKLRKKQDYGNWPQGLQALAAMVFGASSLGVAYSVYTLQQDTRADAELGRAAALLQRLRSDVIQQERFLHAEGADESRAYNCIIYLKLRVTYTPQWAKKAMNGPFLLDPAEIGKQPDPKEVAQGQQSQWEELSDQFNNCVGSNSMTKDVGDQPAQIRNQGIKIRYLIRNALNNDESALMEWQTLKQLPNSSPARKLIEDFVSSDLCTASNFGADVFGLFEALRSSVHQRDAAQELSATYLANYPNLNDFLENICPGKFPKPVATAPASATHP